MTQKFAATITGDIDGSDAVELLERSWEGLQYRIDLSEVISGRNVLVLKHGS